MFERFTSEARNAVIGAVENAEAGHSDLLGVESLLAGVSGCEGSVASRVLEESGASRAALEEALAAGVQDARLLAGLGIDIEQVKDRVESRFGKGAWTRSFRPGGHIPFSKDAKKALELSLRQALRLNSRRIEAGHILLGILQVGGAANEMLHGIGVDPQEVRQRLLQAMKAVS